MRELAVQSANGTNGTDDRANLNAEYQALKTEIVRIGASTKFNGLDILANSAGAQVFQVGANAGDVITVTTNSTALYTAALGTLADQATSSTEIGLIDTALITISTDRGTYGAAQNTMVFAIQNLQNASENQAAARSRIMDADFAQETANLSRSQILQQAGTAMVAQANQLPQSVLQLLK
jgi:flagellin